MMKILIYTTVFPNKVHPNFGIFVYQRMRFVSRECKVVVVSPVAWFPFAGLVDKKYKKYPPYVEIQNNITVYHPRFFLIPRFLKCLDGFFLFICTFWTVKKINKKLNLEGKIMLKINNIKTFKF